MPGTKTALIIIDMQKYYLHYDSTYFKYFNHIHEGCMDYIINRSKKVVIPNIISLRYAFKKKNWPIIYLKLCGTEENRSDLHRFFRKTYEIGKEMGFDNIYPTRSDPMSQFIDEITPDANSIVIEKTTFSAFSSTNIRDVLREHQIKTMVFTGLATSQCVETTARDASDHGYTVIHVEDAQADYDELSHNSSLFSSQGVCGGVIISTEEYIDTME